MSALRLLILLTLSGFSAAASHYHHCSPTLPPQPPSVPSPFSASGGQQQSLQWTSACFHHDTPLSSAEASTSVTGFALPTLYLVAQRQLVYSHSLETGASSKFLAGQLVGETEGTEIRDGTGRGARFRRIVAIAVSDDGLRAFLLDYSVLRVMDTVTGSVLTFMGDPNVRGFADGTQATFDFPAELSYSGGSLWLLDARNACLRQISDANPPTAHPFLGTCGQPGSTTGTTPGETFLSQPSGLGSSPNVHVVFDGGNRRFVVAGVPSNFAEAFTATIPSQGRRTTKVVVSQVGFVTGLDSNSDCTSVVVTLPGAGRALIIKNTPPNEVMKKYCDGGRMLVLAQTALPNGSMLVFDGNAQPDSGHALIRIDGCFENVTGLPWVAQAPAAGVSGGERPLSLAVYVVVSCAIVLILVLIVVVGCIRARRRKEEIEDLKREEAVWLHHQEMLKTGSFGGHNANHTATAGPSSGGSEGGGTATSHSRKGGVTPWRLAANKVINRWSPASAGANNADLALLATADFRLNEAERREAVKKGHFQLGPLIGKGATASVYCGLLPDGTKIAIKKIDITGENPQKRADEISREMAILASLSHTNIVTYYGSTIDLDQRIVVMFMELISGGSLAAVVRDLEDPLAEPIARRFAAQILDGLIYLHDRGVIHRDLKADNVMIESGRGIVKIADFGTARMVDPMKSQVAQTMVGTPYFMAPELILACNDDDEDDELPVEEVLPNTATPAEHTPKNASTAAPSVASSSRSSGGGSGYGTKADVWSFGIMILELLNNGDPPWPQFHSPGQAFMHIGQDGNLPIIPARLSPEATEFCKLCCTRDPRKRPTAKMLRSHAWLRGIDPSKPDGN